MANKIINNNKLTDEKANQLFEAFADLAEQHGSRIDMYAQELTALKQSIQSLANKYAYSKTNKTENVLQAIYTTQKQALTIQEGIEQFYKKGLEYYYKIREIFTTEKITDTVYIEFKDEDGNTRWSRSQNIPFNTIMAAAAPKFILTAEQKSQENDFYHLKAQLQVSYKNLLQELDKIGYDYKNQEEVTSQVEKGLELQKVYNRKKSNESRMSAVNIGNISEALEKTAQDKRYKMTYTNIERVRQNWLSGLLGGDVGEVQVKALSIGSNFQVITLNNITSKFKKLSKTLNSIRKTGRMNIKQIKKFLSLFYVDFFVQVDGQIDKKVLKDIDKIISQATKRKR